MRQRCAAAVLAGLLLVGTLKAQQARTYEKVLLPITAHELPGAFDSLWQTELWIRNDADTFAHVFGYDRNCFIPECPTEDVSPIRSGASIRPRVFGLPGQLLFVERAYADRVAFTFRLRDLNRQAESAGTAIPVVREREFRPEGFSLLDVPHAPDLRHVLRIYDIDGENEREARVRVRIYRLTPTQVTGDGTFPADALLGSAEYALEFAPPPAARKFYPAYFAISDLSRIAPLDRGTRVAVRVEPLSSGMRIWGFALVVDNDTQHVTVISPQ